MNPMSTAPYHEALDLLAAKLIEDERTIGVEFPYVTAPDGAWQTMPASVSAGYTGANWSHGNWFCGFWVGLLLASYLHTRDETFLTLARERMLLVEQRAEDGNTHDIGFIFLSSAMPFYRITGERRYRDIALRAAARLRDRLVVTRQGAYISSWGPMSDPRGRASSAIDTMANIPLLYWAATESGDASFLLAAEAHARMTDRAFTRPDLTLYHAVEYDTTSGDRLRGYTYQGQHDESSWSRGTGWSVYGLAATAGATGDGQYRTRGGVIADKWLAQLGDDVVPPWDFNDTSADAPKDSSASAIMAAALIDLSRLHSDTAERARWQQQADQLLTGLCRDYLARDPAHRGLLTQACYSMPHQIGVQSAVMFGDYFFVEALMRVAMPGTFSLEHRAIA